MLASDLKEIATKKNEEIAEESANKIVQYIFEKCRKVAGDGFYGVACRYSESPDILGALFNYSNYIILVQKKVEEKLKAEGFKYTYINAGPEDDDYVEVTFK